MLVQFGNNWIQKIPLTSKLDSAVLGIFFIQLFPNWTACSPITYTNCMYRGANSYLRSSLPKSGPLDFATKNTFPLFFVSEEALVGI